MVRFPFIFSITLALLLVGGATWYRISDHKTESVGLLTVKEALGSQSSEEAYLEGTPNSNDLVNAAPLSTTDRVSRSLLTDYLALSSENQASSDNLDLLAQKYANELSGGGVLAQKISLLDLEITTNTAANVAQYVKTMETARAGYGSQASLMANGVNFEDVESESFINFMLRVSGLYESSAKQLVAIKVPQSLSQTHLDLINTHLQIAASTKTVAKIETDPAGAYIALNNYAKAAAIENGLIQKIQIAGIYNLATPQP